MSVHVCKCVSRCVCMAARTTSVIGLQPLAPCLQESLLSLTAGLQTPWAHLSASPPLELQANATMTRSFHCFVCLFGILGSENQTQVPVLDSHIIQILYEGLL